LIEESPTIWELDISALNGTTALANVGSKHVGKTVVEALVTCSKCDVCNEVVLFRRALGVASTNVDWSAVHVHLAITDLVEPGPGESGTTAWKFGGHKEFVSVWNWLACIVSKIAGNIPGWATTLNRVDNLPDTVLIRLSIVCDRNLARATAMDCSANEAEWVGGAEIELIDLVNVVHSRSLLAGEIRSIWSKWSVGQAGFGEWLWIAHDNVSAGDGRKAQGDDRVGEMHDDSVDLSFVPDDRIEFGFWCI
jgi:hypothetical protein